MKRSTTLLLTASLLINIFALGALGGGLFMLLRPDAFKSHLLSAHRPLREAGAELPLPDRQRFIHTLRAALRDGRALTHAAQDNRAAAAALFEQPHFDEQAANAALAQARDADFQLRTRLEESIIHFAATLPDDERATFAQALAKGGPLRHPEHAKARKVIQP